MSPEKTVTELQNGDAQLLDDGRPLDDVVKAVAQNVKRVRTARGLSQAELARRSGIAKATLSQLEVAKGNPTIETLFALTKVLAVPLGVLLHEDATTPIDVSRAAGRPVIEGAAVDMSLTDTFSSGAVLHEIYLMHVRVGRQEGKPHAGGVQERILVMEGRLLTGPIDQPVEVAAGDYICFDADRPHVYEALRKPVTATLLITYPLSAPAGGSAA
jgi:transcriptional regulator with XRE-family HTH domain